MWERVDSDGEEKEEEEEREEDEEEEKEKEEEEEGMCNGDYFLDWYTWSFFIVANRQPWI